MNNNTFVHKYIGPLIKKDDICVDMTAGNGNDTLFLAEKARLVYAFDISAEAIRRTAEKTKACSNVILINDSHSNIDLYVRDKVRLCIFNLGYLPNSDQKSITQAQDTLIAFNKAYDILADDAYIVITFYLGHPGGKDEFYLLDENIHKRKLTILERYSQNRLASPITYIIRKSV